MSALRHLREAAPVLAAFAAASAWLVGDDRSAMLWSIWAVVLVQFNALAFERFAIDALHAVIVEIEGGAK